MKITTVLTAINNNPKQSRFVPFFIRSWKKLYPDFQIRIVFIGSELPPELEPYREHFVFFPEIPGVSTVQTAQTIRILYPALLEPDEVTVITDMDMLPGNRTQFRDKVAHVPDNAFLSLRPLSVVKKGEIAICQNAASTDTWKRVFGVQTEQEIRTFLTQHQQGCDGLHGGRGWEQDQTLLFRQATQDPHFVALDESGFRRLDQFHHQQKRPIFEAMLESEQYSDAHLQADACPWNFEDLK